MAETLHLHTTGLTVAALPNGKGVRLTDKAGNQVVIHGPADDVLKAGTRLTAAAKGATRMSDDQFNDVIKNSWRGEETDPDDEDEPQTVAEGIGRAIGYTLVVAGVAVAGLILYGIVRHLAGWALG